MRRTVKATSARSSNRRKPMGPGPGTPSGRFRFAVLSTAVATFLLVPVVQAAASGLKVNIAGTGSGEVKTNFFYDTTEPPIECVYESFGPATGTCESPVGEELNALAAIPAEGSEFAGWTIKKGSAAFFCDGSEEEKEIAEVWSVEEPFSAFFAGAEGACVIEPEGGSSELTALFEGEVIVDPPHSHRVLVVGEGAVTSSPGGIVCNSAKPETECEFDFEAGGAITLTALPVPGWAFKGWSGCATHVGLTCAVTMSSAGDVKVTFVPTPSLTVEKAGSGFGKISAGGISCDESCSNATAAFRADTVVTVKAAPAKGSEAAVFEGGTGSASGCSGATAASQSPKTAR